MAEYADPVIDWLDQDQSLVSQRYFRQVKQKGKCGGKDRHALTKTLSPFSHVWCGTETLSRISPSPNLT